MRTLIVDGYNLIHAVPRYAQLAATDIDSARERLIADLGARAAEGQPVTVVFDGGGNPSSDGTPRSMGGVTVIFSPAGTEADSVIEGLAAAIRSDGEEAEVVTSDAATRWTSVGAGVVVTRASSFGRELQADDEEWREHPDATGSATLEQRIDAETRRRLDRLSGRSGPRDR